jgi:hypothetical protein
VGAHECCGARISDWRSTPIALPVRQDGQKGVSAERLAKSPGVVARVKGPAEGVGAKVVHARLGQSYQLCGPNKNKRALGSLRTELTYTPLRQDFCQRAEELLVLLRSPERDTEVARATECAATAHQHATLTQSGNDRRVISVLRNA